jgi:transcriptional regulator with XRE-family HTH domain
MSTIGDRIKKIRESKNYTQDHLAGKLGISQNSYSKLETGTTKITTDRLQQIAAVLEVPIEELLNSEHQTINFNNSHVEKFYGYIEHLQEDNKEHTKMLYEQVRYLQNENERLLGTVEKLTLKNSN